MSTPSPMNGGLAVDVVAYPDASIIDQLYLSRLRANRPSPPPANSPASTFRWQTRRRSPAGSWLTCRLSCRASTTSDAPAGPIATSGAPASRSKAISSIPSQGRYEHRNRRHLVPGGTLSRRAGVRAFARRKGGGRRRAVVDRARYRRRTAPSCSCSTPAPWPNWRGQMPPTPFRSTSTAPSVPKARLDLSPLLADIPGEIQGRSVTRAAALHMIFALPASGLFERKRK